MNYGFAESYETGHRRYVVNSVVVGCFIAICIALSYPFGRDGKLELLWPGLANGLLALYVVLGHMHRSENDILRVRYAESAYFLGYLATVAALVVLALHIAPNRQLDFQAELPRILSRGGLAVTSTVVGLFGMFTLRLRVLRPEGGGDQGSASSPLGLDASWLEALRAQGESVLKSLGSVADEFRTKQADSLLQLSRSLQDLDAKVQGLSAALVESPARMQSFHTSAALAAATLGDVASHASSLATTATRLLDVSQELAPAAEQMAAFTQASAGLTALAGELAGALETLKVSSVSASEHFGKFTEAGTRTQNQLLDMLSSLQARAAAIGTLADPVNRFVDAANRMAPELNLIVANLREVLPLSTAVRQLLDNIQSLNPALSKTATSTAEISENSRKLMLSTGDLVGHLENQVHKLDEQLKKRLTELDKVAAPLEQFAQRMTPILEQLEPVNEAVRRVTAFSAGASDLQQRLAELRASLEDFQGAVKSSTADMRDIKDVMEDFANRTTEFYRQSA